MRVLHYALGFPPYRSGGLTKFCIDLMVQQAKEGHEVAMLWPGQMCLIKKTTLVKKRENIILKDQSIQSFEIINPLPISFDEGISNFAEFTRDNGKSTYNKFLNEFEPDVIHVHTLMGLHKNFLLAAKAKSIRLVFTAHDFFPICPKVTLFRHGTICRSVCSCENCGVCNATALGLTKIKILQSPIYRELKDSSIVKFLRKKHRDNYLSDVTANDSVEPVGTAKDYKNLRNYYYSLLKLMDIIHYNSSITKSVYESIFELPNNCILSITHSDIKDNRKVKTFSKNKIRIRYLGPQSGAKGYFLLRKALDELWKKQDDFCLDIHFDPIKVAPYIHTHDRYSYKDLGHIFDETDILVAPSVWYETFGYTVLEALSYGVPVIISDTVGAKDILADGVGVIFNSNNSESLCEVLQDITPKKLEEMNRNIINKQKIMQIEDMSKQIEKNCYWG